MLQRGRRLEPRGRETLGGGRRGGRQPGRGGGRRAASAGVWPAFSAFRCSAEIHIKNNMFLHKFAFFLYLFEKIGAPRNGIFETLQRSR